MQNSIIYRARDEAEPPPCHWAQGRKPGLPDVPVALQGSSNAGKRVPPPPPPHAFTAGNQEVAAAQTHAWAVRRRNCVGECPWLGGWEEGEAGLTKLMVLAGCS